MKSEILVSTYTVLKRKVSVHITEIFIIIIIIISNTLFYDGHMLFKS